jgi:nucleoside-diphosphate-sugar epimerase
MSPERISAQSLERKRKDRSTRFFLTGGTGFLGSHVAVELLKRGFEVSLLARSDERRSAAERVGRLLDWFALPAEPRLRLRVVEGDIMQPGLGIDSAELFAILKGTDEIVHLASDTSFSERKRPQVEAVNIGGLSRVLEFARASQAGFFHHVSTAFVAGKTTGTCFEEPVLQREFNNVYEETKSRGESTVSSACGEAGIGSAIYRPSIVYGDSRTGRSLRFDAVYHPVKMALFVKDMCERDIREGDGSKARELGVSIGPDGTTHLPMRIEIVEQGGVNIIPVDYFTDSLLALMEATRPGAIFHIASPKLTKIEDISDYSSRLFHLSGISTCTAQELVERPKRPIELLFSHYVGAYGPYMKDTRAFDMTKSAAILGPRGIVCPDFGYDIFSKCMLFAVTAEWGAGLFRSS